MTTRQDVRPSIEAAANVPEISIVMPCLNEEQTIGKCIQKAQWALEEHSLNGEIVVADNGSTDRSVEICESLGVRVVHQQRRGYGNAYLKGIESARGKYIIIADSDDTYDLREIIRFVDPLKNGYDLVMGNRFQGKIMPGAMTWSHRYIGNPVLSSLMKIMFGTNVGDSHSGIRAFTRETYMRLRLRAPGMEFASEMVINAAKMGLRVVEVPITYYPREGVSKLRTVRDGWRHLRYMLLRSPTHLFIAPGLLLLALGVFALVPFLWGQVVLLGRPFDIHAMFLAGMAALLGYQVLLLGLFAKVMAIREGVDTEDRILKSLLGIFRLERGLILGLSLLLIGAIVGLSVASKWLSSDFGPLSLTDTRISFFGFTVILLGVQTVFASFYMVLALGYQETGALGPKL